MWKPYFSSFPVGMQACLSGHGRVYCMIHIIDWFILIPQGQFNRATWVNVQLNVQFFVPQNFILITLILYLIKLGYRQPKYSYIQTKSLLKMCPPCRCILHRLIKQYAHGMFFMMTTLHLVLLIGIESRIRGSKPFLCLPFEYNPGLEVPSPFHVYY